MSSLCEFEFEFMLHILPVLPIIAPGTYPG